MFEVWQNQNYNHAPIKKIETLPYNVPNMFEKNKTRAHIGLYIDDCHILGSKGNYMEIFQKDVIFNKKSILLITSYGCPFAVFFLCSKKRIFNIAIDNYGIFKPTYAIPLVVFNLLGTTIHPGYYGNF